VDDKFLKVTGVISTQVGYTGGHTENPTYEEVCSDTTGHAEAVEITFKPEKISYKELLSVFWRIHNPTTLNRQGFNVGSQYRSAIFYHNDEQKELALESKPENAVTEIVPATKF
jgi:peptide-methionine (S)-S-oxide reductase